VNKEEVRIAHLKDVDEIYLLHKKNILNNWSYDMLVDDYKQPSSSYYVYTINNKIVAYIAISIVVDEITITDIVVDEKYRNTGIATKLINHVEEIAKEKKVVSIFLEVRINNESAINLYKKLNFYKISVRKDYYNNPVCDAIVMVRKL